MLNKITQAILKLFRLCILLLSIISAIMGISVFYNAIIVKDPLYSKDPILALILFSAVGIYIFVKLGKRDTKKPSTEINKQDIILSPESRIIEETKHLINTTTNPEVFFMRYNFLLETLKKASVDEAHDMILQKEKYINEFLIRAQNKLISETDSLKSTSGKINRITSFYSKLNEYKRHFSKDNLELLEQLNSQSLNYIKSQTQASPVSPDSYITTNGITYKTDHSKITDEDAHYLIEQGFRNRLQLISEHELGMRNIFTENTFSEDEHCFFSALLSAVKEKGLKPNLIQLDSLSDGTWNVNYVGNNGCYVGKIRLNPGRIPTEYAVMKNGQKRAMRVFDVREEADKYLKEKGGDSIEERKGSSNSNYMQYTIGLYNTKHLENPTLQECIDTIHRWVKYINYCKRN